MRQLIPALLLLTLLLPAAAAAQSPVTRVQFVAALWTCSGAVPYDANGPFSDVNPNSPGATAVAWAYDLGIVRGTGGTLFVPDRPITREEAAVLLRRYAVHLGRDTFLPSGVAACNDFEGISPWADDSLYWAAGIGLLAWGADGRPEPQGTLSPEGLSIAYWARSSRDTLCNLTNHSYFNLNGHASGPVAGQYIQINAGRYTPADGGSIPTGELAPVEGTPMDLRAGVRIGARIDEDFPQLTMAGGYDHNWVVDGPAGTLRPAARAWSEETGIVLAVSTTMPGVQFYTGNYLDGCPAGKGNAPYGKRWGFCLETQFFPDAVHHPEFPSPVLRAGAEYRQETRFCFSVDK